MLSPVILLCTLFLQGPPLRTTEDLTRGIRFDPPLNTLAEAPSDPNVLYLGTERGRVYVTEDRGRSWSEMNVLTSRGSFYGAIRPQGKASSIFFNSGMLRGYYRPGHIVKVEDPDVSDRYDGADRFSLGMFNYLARDHDSPTVGGGGGGSSRLGVGLSNTAPRLAMRVRKKKKWGIGIKIKQTLALKTGAATAIRFLSVHPRDSKDILAATADGLYRSRDGGYSWPLVLTGAAKPERNINTLARDPREADRIYAGSSRGLNVSEDGGDTWRLMANPLVSQSDIRWVSFHPEKPDDLLVGVTWGILRSRDKEHSKFSLLFTSPWPPQKMIRRVIYDPHTPTRILAATADGLMISEDDGKSFDRAGGLLFVGQDLNSLSPGSAPGHFIVADKRDIWETFDAGKSWQVALFGSIEWTLRMAFFSRHDPEAIWIVTYGEVLRYAPMPSNRLPRDLMSRMRALVASEPSLDQAVGVALRRFGVDRPFLTRYRQGARLAGWVPKIRASFRWTDLRVGTTSYFRDIHDPYFRNHGQIGGPAWALVALWDLKGIIHNVSESIADRVGGVSRHAEWRVRQTLINLYQERRRFQLEALIDRGDERARFMRRLRLEELTAHLNALTGNLFKPISAL